MNNDTSTDYEDEIEDNEDFEENTIRVNEEFFLKGFQKGSKIYDYILYGKNKEILNEIPNIPNIAAFAREKELEIVKRFNYYGVDFFDEIIEPFISHQLDSEIYQSFIGKLFSKKYNTNPEERALRVVDVFFRIYNSRSLDHHTLESITQTFELCDLEDALVRFTNTNMSKEELLSSIKGLMNEFLKDEMSKEELVQLNTLFMKDKSIWDKILNSIMHNREEGIDEDIIAVMPKLQESKVTGIHLLTIAFVISKNYVKDDIHIEKLLDFYTKNILSVFIRILKEYGKTSYYVGNDLIDQEYLIDDIAKYCNNSNEKTDEEIAKTLKELCFLNDENIEKKLGINHISLFSSDDMQTLLSSILYVNEFLASKEQKQTNKIFNLILDLAPVKTLHQASKSFINESHFNDIKFKNKDTLTNFITKLRDYGVKEKYILAWQINRTVRLKNSIISINDFLEEQVEDLVDAYIKQDSYKKVLPYLDDRTSREFLSYVNEKSPKEEYFDICKKQFDKALYTFTRSLIPRIKSKWEMNEDEKDELKEKIKEKTKILNDYFFKGSSFNEIEKFITNEKPENISEDLNEIIHFFNDDIQKRFLYLLAKLENTDNIHYYFRTAKEEEFEEYGLVHELFYFLKDCNIDESFALYYIIDAAKRENNYKIKEDKRFTKAFYDLCPNLNIEELSKEYKKSDIKFINKLIKEYEKKSI